MADINKIGLLVVDNGLVLLVRKRGLEALILPGGKVEGGEAATECLRREIREELGDDVDVENVTHIDDYEDVAASDDPSVHKMLRISLYRGALSGQPAASSEIDELVWLDVADLNMPDVQASLSPIIRNKIFPDLIERRIIA